MLLQQDGYLRSKLPDRVAIENHTSWYPSTNAQLKKTQTNADKLQAMSVEELAALCENGCPPRRGCPDLTKEDVDKSYHELCQKCWLDWLKQEVEE